MIGSAAGARGLPTGEDVTFADVSTTAGGTASAMVLSPAHDASVDSSVQIVGSELTRVYADPGTTV